MDKFKYLKYKIEYDIHESEELGEDKEFTEISLRVYIYDNKEDYENEENDVEGALVFSDVEGLYDYLSPKIEQVEEYFFKYKGQIIPEYAFILDDKIYPAGGDNFPIENWEMVSGDSGPMYDNLDDAISDYAFRVTK